TARQQVPLLKQLLHLQLNAAFPGPCYLIPATANAGGIPVRHPAPPGPYSQAPADAPFQVDVVLPALPVQLHYAVAVQHIAFHGIYAAARATGAEPGEPARQPQAVSGQAVLQLLVAQP